MTSCNCTVVLKKLFIGLAALILLLQEMHNENPFICGSISAISLALPRYYSSRSTVERSFTLLQGRLLSTSSSPGNFCHALCRYAINVIWLLITAVLMFIVGLNPPQFRKSYLLYRSCAAGSLFGSAQQLQSLLYVPASWTTLLSRILNHCFLPTLSLPPAFA